MQIRFHYFELTFINSYEEIKKQIRNTAVISFLLKEGFKGTKLEHYLENTQYGFTASALDTGTHRLVRITDILEGEVNWENVPYCDCKESQKYILNRGDILVARTGGTTGKSLLIDLAPSNAVFASYLIRLRIKDDYLPEFVNIFLNSYAYWSQIFELKSGSAQPNVNAEKLKTLIIPDCPLNVQRKVVDALNDSVKPRYSEFIIALKKSIHFALSKFDQLELLKKEFESQRTLLQQLRQSILRDAAEGKLTKQNPSDEPASKLLERIKAEKRRLTADGQLKKEKELPPISPEEIPFELPEGWLWCRLGEIVNLVSGVTLGKSYKEELFNVPYLRVANVQRGYVDTNKVKQLYVPKSEIDKYALQKGDLVMIEGGDWDKVGRCAIWDGRISPCIHQNHIFRLRFYGNISSRWAELFLNSPIARKYFESCSKQTTNLASINKTQLSCTLFALPSLSEQKRVVAKAQQLLQTVSLLEKQVEENRMQAQYLLEAVLKEAFQLSYPTTTMAH